MSGMDRATALAQVAEAHHNWVQQHLPDAEKNFVPNPESGDANVWQLEAAGDPDREADFASRVQDIDFSQIGGLEDEGPEGGESGTSEFSDEE